MRIGVLGSAFDPPHKAHRKLGERAKKALKLDHLVLMPTKIPPHKTKPNVSAGLRLKMAKILAGKRKGWMVSDIELKRPGKSYTRDTIKELKKRHPNDQIFWIIGSDSLVAMPRQWKGGYDVLDLCTFVVAPRKGYPLARVPKRILKKVIILPGQTLSISSTKLREFLRKGKSVSRFLDPKIMKLIKRHHLYTQTYEIRKII